MRACGMRAGGMRAGIDEQLTPKQYRKTISEIKRERKKGNLEIGVNKYAELLHEVIMQDPVIKKRIITMKKRYPNLSQECYEMEHHFLVQKKVEDELYRDTDPLNPRHHKKSIKNKKEQKKLLKEHMELLGQFQLSPQIQHAEVQEKIDEIKELEAELPLVETKDEKEAIIEEIVEIVKELKEMKPVRKQARKAKKPTKKDIQDSILKKIKKLQIEKDALGPVRKENPNFEELASIHDALADQINTLHKQLPKRKPYVRKAKGQGIQRHRIRRY